MSASQHVPITLNVLEYRTNHRGTACTAEDISQRVSCTLSQAQKSLETLADACLITRLPPVTGVVTYLIPT